MNRLTRAIRSAVRHFEQMELPYALVGGLAVSARTEPRFTRDADFALAASDDRHAEKIVRHFISANYQVVSTVEQDAVGRLATARLVWGHGAAGAVGLDLLFASSGIEEEIIEGSDRIEILENLTVPVCSLGHLLALKILSVSDGRPQDKMDIRALLEAANEIDIKLARDALLLITERGYHRDRTLVADLNGFIQKSG